MPKDTEEERQKEELEEKKEETKVNWFQKVPVMYKLGGIGILLFKYLGIKNNDGDMQSIIPWAIVVIAAWVFLGSEGKRRRQEILTPEEAELALEGEITRKKQKGQIPRFAEVFIGPNNGMFFHEGMPQHYIIGVQIRNDNLMEYKRGIVFATGEQRGYATIQDMPGKVTGREPIPIVRPFPQWLKRSKDFGVDVDRFIFGENK